MLNTRAVRGWHQMLANQGFVAAFRVASARIVQRLKPHGNEAALTQAAAVQSHPASAIHPFDRQYGVDTSGLIWGEHLVSGNRNDRWSTAYYGIAPSVFRNVLSQIKESVSGASFIDIGSGKGRAVMLATQLPFAKVYGVEIAPSLHAIATANLEAFRASAVVTQPVQLTGGDAAEFAFPVQPLVLFLYHPFCKPVLKTVLQRLEQSLREHPRPAHIVYINTELREVLDDAPYLDLVFAQTLTMSDEDQMADRVGSTAEECAIYVSNIRA